MEASLEEQCTALGGLFQQIVAELKNGAPLWEDLVVKALKLHSCLRTAISAISGYLDAFQKIADAATSARGATKEIGTALTRICLRHRAVESRMKVLTSTIMDRLISPLQDKLEEWKKTVVNLDKDHAKEYKKARSELKKRSTDTLRLQKKVRKGKAGELAGLAGRVESSLADVTESRSYLEQTETRAVRAALIEHRSRFCVLVDCIQPVVDEEVGLLCEMGHIQEAAEQLMVSAADPAALPASGEELLEGLVAADRACERTFTLRTPPSSPSSLGSRKSSMASISSLSSGSSSAKWHASVSQLSELCVGESEDADSAGSPGGAIVNQGPGCPPHGTSWPNMADKIQFERAASAILTDRPHTISSGYERGHHRTPLSVHTFQTPQSQPSSPGAELNAQPPPPRRDAAQAPPLRPPIPQRGSSLPLAQPPCPRPTGARIRPVADPSLGTETQGVYVNMSELAWMAASKAQEMAASLPPPPPELTAAAAAPFLRSERECSTSESSVESSGYGSNDTGGFVGRKMSMNGPKPPPPLRRTASISCHSVQPLLPPHPQTTHAPLRMPSSLPVHNDHSGSRENLPPPPDFLLENNDVSHETPCVADKVRALTALHHTPASPHTARKAARSISLERRDSVISALASRLSHPLSPRHLRRHSEGVGRAGQKLLVSLNARLAMQTSHHRPDPALLRASLMEEIKQGTHLKKTATVNDRSAPKIY